MRSWIFLLLIKKLFALLLLQTFISRSSILPELRCISKDAHYFNINDLSTKLYYPGKNRFDYNPSVIKFH